MSDLIIIPARYGSTRFPGKPLATIGGIAMIERVVRVAERASKIAGDTSVLVAIDDQRIFDFVVALGVDAVMTSLSAENGSARALEAVREKCLAPGVVVNLQGDAPFTSSAAIADILKAARTADAAVVTPLVRLDWAALDALRETKKHSPFTGTTCIRGRDGHALWFSKAILPAIRDEANLRESQSMSPVWMHIGAYAYRMEALHRFAALPGGEYEHLEGLEQLRLLEAGCPILTLEAAPSIWPMTGIDTPEDADQATALIEKFGDPLASL
jgi:3-deoxy-manno-octulosonate cytidylyltransferase (CMP-KDO synthetase)